MIIIDTVNYFTPRSQPPRPAVNRRPATTNRRLPCRLKRRPLVDLIIYGEWTLSRAVTESVTLVARRGSLRAPKK